MNPRHDKTNQSWAAQARAAGFARIDGALVADAAGTTLAPGTLVLEKAGPDVSPPGHASLSGRWRVCAAIPTSEADHTERWRSVPCLSLPGHALIPGLVNAHTHLDLTHIGPRSYDADGGFVGWVEIIRRERATDADLISASVRRGVELSLLGGTVAVGDISGAVGGKASTLTTAELACSALAGISFVEFFAIGTGQERGLASMRAAIESAGAFTGSVRLGLQPHAPNTVSAAAYAVAAEEAERNGLRLSTHLAETSEEREFVARAAGPQRELLERLGLWNASVMQGRPPLGSGCSPVKYLEPVLRRSKFLLAHVNAVDDADIALLAETRQFVAYCPRAHEYFGHEPRIGPHRYRDLLAAGVCVAIGTDSIVNLPPESAMEFGPGISVLDELRLLFRRDKTDPATLLAMGTTHGAEALRLDRRSFTFDPGADLAGLVAVALPGKPGQRSLTDLMASSGRAELLFIRK